MSNTIISTAAKQIAVKAGALTTTLYIQIIGLYARWIDGVNLGYGQI